MNFISPIQFGNAELIELSIDTNPAAENFDTKPNTDNVVSQFTIEKSVSFETSNDRMTCKCTLRLDWTIASEEEKPRDLARIKCKIAGLAFVGGNTEKDDSKIQSHLEANAISYLWAKTRDWVELVSACSIIGRITLPAILPYNLLGEGENPES